MKKIIVLASIAIMIAISAAYCYAYQSHTYNIRYNPNSIVVDKTGNIWLGNNKHKHVIEITHSGKQETSYNTGRFVYGLFVNKNNNILTSAAVKINLKKNQLNPYYTSMSVVGIDNNNNVYFIRSDSESFIRYSDINNQLKHPKIYNSYFEFMIMSNLVFTKNDALWFTTNMNSVVKISPSLKIVGNYKIPFSLDSGAIAIGKHGNVWITTDNDTVIKISPSGKIINTYNFFTNNTHSPKSALAARTIALKIGKHGNIWIYNPQGTIESITGHISSSGAVSSKKVTEKVIGNNLLIKMSPIGKIIKKYYIKANNANNIMAIGKRGNIWIAIGNDRIMKIINK